MKVIALKCCDAKLPDGRKALFPGQGYDIPKAEAERLAKKGCVRLKSVKGPPEDKAADSAEDKAASAEPPPAEPDYLDQRAFRRKRRTGKAK